MVELWLVVEPQVNNTLYWAKEFFTVLRFRVAVGMFASLQGRQNRDPLSITMQYYAKYLGSRDDHRPCLDRSLSGK